MGQLSHPYMTTRKTISLTIWTSIGKVMSLLFNMLSRLVIAFLPRNKLQSSSAVILEPKKTKSAPFPLFPQLCAMKWWDWVLWSSFFECWVLSQLFHSPLSPLFKMYIYSQYIYLYFVHMYKYIHLHMYTYIYFQIYIWKILTYSRITEEVI